MTEIGPFQYQVYGLNIQSTGRIPGLIPRKQDSRPDTCVYLNISPRLGKNGSKPPREIYASPELDTQGIPLLLMRERLDENLYQLSYSDGTEFHVDRGGNEIWCTWPDTLTVEDTVTYLLGPILGCVLSLKGITCLHASAFIFRDHAVALLGPAGSGKSTTVAALAKQGFPILTDDVAALFSSNGRIEVSPGYPRLRLWPESVKALFGSPDKLSRLTPNWEKCFLDLTEDGYWFSQYSYPLSTIYYLRERRSDPHSPSIERLSPQEALLKLVGNSYGKYLLNKERLAWDFRFFGELLTRVPIRALVPHTESSKLSKLCEGILRDLGA